MFKKILLLLIISPSLLAQTTALNFDGTNDYVEFDGTVPLGTADNFTIEMWVKIENFINTQGQNPLYGEYSITVGGGATANYFHITNDSLLYFGQYIGSTGSAFRSKGKVPGNKWVHIAYVQDGLNDREHFYINGQLDSTRTGMIQPNSMRQYALIGARTGSGAIPRYFDGSIDEFRIWNVVRSQSEIEDNMVSELLELPSDLLTYIKFNEGTRGGNNVAINAIQDTEGYFPGITPVNFTKSGASSNWVNGAPLRIYVNKAATGLNNGGTWENAFTELNTATFFTQQGLGKEVWVAKGIYKPTGGSRSSSFVISDEVKVIGGFGGGEAVNYDLNLRKLELNKTILSGDIGVVGDNSDNSYSVVTTTNVSPLTELNGFTIQDGRADDTGVSLNNTNVGGGWYNIANTPVSVSSPTVQNCIFQNNYARSSGGGMANAGVGSAGAIIRNCIFEGNESESQGAGLFARRTSVSAPLLCYSSAFSGNSTSGSGGGCYVASSTGINQALFQNCTFLSNGARSGGGLYVNMVSGTFSAAIRNSVFWGNRALLFNSGDIENGIQADNGATYNAQHSLIQGSTNTSLGNILGTTDPKFVSVTDPAGPTLEADFRLLSCSPLINTGLSIGSPVRDVFNKVRPGGNGGVDIGAHEFQGSTSSNIVYVVDTAGNYGSGSLWSDAFSTIQLAITAKNQCSDIDEIWVAAGTYHPTSGTARSTAFDFDSDTKLFGGFEGTETPSFDLNLRDFVANETILSGNIGDPIDSLDNSYTIVNLAFNSQDSEIDGFTIEKGQADGPSGVANTSGAGILIWANNNATSISLTVKNCIFKNNYAVNGGGILSQATASGSTTLRIENCSFLSNRDGFSGASIENNAANSGVAVIDIQNSSFRGNEGSGGSIRNISFFNGTARLKCENCLMTGNKSTVKGAALFNSQYNPSVATSNIINSTFSGNKSFNGAGLNNLRGQVYLTNSIFWNNDDFGGTGINTESSGVTTIRYSMVENRNDNTGGNLASIDPLFASSIDPNTAPSLLGDFRLQNCSPVADKGINDSLSVDLLVDLDKNTRVFNDSNLPTAIVDLGAYEHQGLATQTSVNIDAAISSDQLIFGDKDITSGEIINSPAEVLFHAGESILLNAGFQAESGAVFTAKIGVPQCPN